MASTDFLPRRVDKAFDRMAVPDNLKSVLLFGADVPGYTRWFDHFLGDALNARYPADGGTGTQVVGVTAAVNGTATLATQGNQATDSAILTGPGLHWNGDNTFYFAAKAKLSTLTDCKFSIGVTDEQTDTGPVNDKAAATFNVSDCAVFSFNAADDTNLTLQTNGGATDLNLDSAHTMVADTFTIFEIVAADNNVSFFVNGKYMGGQAGGIEGGVAMMPVFYVEQNDTAAITLTIDWMGIVGPEA